MTWSTSLTLIRLVHVINKTNKTISDITPLIMLINASGEGWRDVAQALIAQGADPDMEVNYYNGTTTAREIANKYRGGSLVITTINYH